MFSYRHGFHAGNHADVLKHTVLIQLLAYLNQKPTPYMVIDTHAGAGLYQLDSDYANKSGEASDGIAKLWERKDLPPAIAEYVALIRAMNPAGKLRHYPGSIAVNVSRPSAPMALRRSKPCCRHRHGVAWY